MKRKIVPNIVPIGGQRKKGGGCEKKKGVRKKGGGTQHRHPPLYTPLYIYVYICHFVVISTFLSILNCHVVLSIRCSASPPVPLSVDAVDGSLAGDGVALAAGYLQPPALVHLEAGLQPVKLLSRKSAIRTASIIRRMTEKNCEMGL